MKTNAEGDEWPAGHTIGVYLSVEGHSRLVGTARTRDHLSGLFRHLADEWDRMLLDPTVRDSGAGFSAMELVLSAGSHPARGA